MESGQSFQGIRIVGFQFQDFLIFPNRLRLLFRLFIGGRQIESNHRITRIQCDRLSVILDLLPGQSLAAIGQAEIGIDGGILRLSSSEPPDATGSHRHNSPSST